MKYCKAQKGNIASVHNNQENDALIKLAKATAFLGAESDGKGKWKWNDGSKWWQPAGTQHDGIVGKGETKIALNTDKKWHDWGVGADKLGVLCAMKLGGTLCVKCAVYPAVVLCVWGDCLLCCEFLTALYGCVCMLVCR